MKQPAVYWKLRRQRLDTAGRIWKCHKAEKNWRLAQKMQLKMQLQLQCSYRTSSEMFWVLRHTSTGQSGQDRVPSPRPCGLFARCICMHLWEDGKPFQSYSISKWTWLDDGGCHDELPCPWRLTFLCHCSVVRLYATFEDIRARVRGREHNWQAYSFKLLPCKDLNSFCGNRCHNMTAQPASSTDQDVSTPPHYRGSSRASAKKVSLCVSASFSFCTGSGAAKKLQGPKGQTQALLAQLRCLGHVGALRCSAMAELHSWRRVSADGNGRKSWNSPFHWWANTIDWICVQGEGQAAQGESPSWRWAEEAWSPCLEASRGPQRH